MIRSLIGYGDDLAAVRAYRALGATSTRIEILRAILASGETSAGELMESFSMTRNGITRHLAALVDENLLIERHDTHPRGAGPITYWRADPDEVSLLLDTLASHVLGRLQAAT